MEKSELLVQIAKVSKNRIERINQMVHNFQVTKIGKKRMAKMTTTDFISIQGQQNFEDDAEINSMEIKIENDKIQNMFEKYKKNPVKFTLEGLPFSCAFKMSHKKFL